jgi:hypothetical protein
MNAPTTAGEIGHAFASCSRPCHQRAAFLREGAPGCELRIADFALARLLR